MNNIKFKKLVSLTIFIFPIMTSAKNNCSDGVLQVLANSLNIENYGNYPLFLQSLGFDNPKIPPLIVETPDSTNSKPLHTRQEFNLVPTMDNAFAKATQNAQLTIIRSEDKTTEIVSFSANIKTSELCISKTEFSIFFAPVKTQQATDFGGIHLEKNFPGALYHGMAAFFTDDGCMKKIYISQNPN